jgi:hypothetical protein
MSGTARKFELIGETAASPPPEQPNVAATVNAQMLLLSLRALSQRAMTAVTNLFTLMLVASVWGLAWRVLPDPSMLQLAELGGYAMFCLLIDMVRRRK